MRKKVLIVMVVLAVTIMLGEQHFTNFGENNHWSLSDTMKVTVHQWLDVENIRKNPFIDAIHIYDYDVEYTYDPDSPQGVGEYVLEILNIDTNATGLYIGVDGFYEDSSLQSKHSLDDYLKTKRWLLFQWAPGGGYIPAQDEWQDFGKKILLDSTKEHVRYINGQPYTWYIDLDGDNRFGLGLILKVDEDTPAGEYTVWIKIFFEPWIKFE